ncbi:MAG: hypothetical protein WAX77_08195 [Methylococcaceae bacterium]
MALLIQYLASCLFTKDPKDLQPPLSFMLKTIAFYLGSGIIVEGLIADFADGTLEVLLRTIMAFSSISVFLLVKKRFQEFQQLFTAIFVCENLIMTLAVAVEALYFYMVMEHIEASELISWILGGFLLVWYLAIVAYIIRRFFEYDIIASLILAFGYFVLTYGIPMMFMDM